MSGLASNSLGCFKPCFKYCKMQLPSYLDPFLDLKSKLPISFSPGSCFGISMLKVTQILRVSFQERKRKTYYALRVVNYSNQAFKHCSGREKKHWKVEITLRAAQCVCQSFSHVQLSVIPFPCVTQYRVLIGTVELRK